LNGFSGRVSNGGYLAGSIIAKGESSAERIAYGAEMAVLKMSEIVFPFESVRLMRLPVES